MPEDSRCLWEYLPKSSIYAHQSGEDDPEEERKRLSKRSRQREIGARRRFTLSLRDQVLLLLFYYTTYTTQDVATEVLGVG